MIKSFSAMVTAILLLLPRTSDSGPHGYHAAVREIDVDKVRWRHGFWADWFNQAHDVIIPFMWKYFQGQTHSIGIEGDEASFVWDNFLLAAQRKEGRYRPLPGSKWGDRLHGPVPSTLLQPIDIRMIPYYAWNNRGVCQMTVWTPVVWTVTQTHESEK